MLTLSVINETQDHAREAVLREVWLLEQQEEPEMIDIYTRQSTLDTLEFKPSIDAASIGVAVDNGIVTLTGHVPTYS